MGLKTEFSRVEIDGYAAVFDVPDQAGDIIRRGAFSANGKKLIDTEQFRGTMLYQHAADRPLGRWLECREDQYGLLVHGEIFLDTDIGRNAYALLRGGGLDGLSIGFKPRRVRRQRDGRRELLSLALWEISIVTFPMADGARIQRVGVPNERLPRNLL